MKADHSYMEVVRFRKENGERYWCNYSSHGVSSEDPGSARNRLRSEDVVVVENKPRFTIRKGAAVYTIGSCFARNVERALLRQGFKVPTAEIEIDKNIYMGNTPFRNTVLNKYNAHSMATEIVRGLSDSPPLGLIEVDEGQWYDPQTNFTKLLSFEVASKLRRDLDALARNVVSSDLVVLTLGLVETWFDTRSGVVYNGLNVVAVKNLRGQTGFFSATVDQVVSVLSDALEKLKESNPDVKVVITVSPVPMAQTFTDSDVFAANTYSKSVLRVASEMLRNSFDFVDYFPSYEMVMNSPRAMTWAEDQIHVSPPVVERVISTFSSRYISD